MYCEKCGHVLDGTTQLCPVCDVSALGGGQVKRKKGLRAVKVAIAVVLLAAIGVGGAWAYFTWFAKTPIDESHFPDATLRAYVAEFADTDKDGALSSNEAKAVECIGRPSGLDHDQDGAFLVGDVSTFAGIEFLPNLKMIVCAPSTVVGDAKGLESEFLCVKEEQIINQDEGSQEDQKTITFSEYDTFGRIVKDSIADSEGSDECQYYRTYTYSDEGNLVEEADYDSAWTKFSYRVNEYDERDRKIKTSYVEVGQGLLWEEYYYDFQDNLTEVKECSDDGVLQACTRYEYDEAGKITKKSSFDSEEALTEYCTYEYGTQGILSEIRYFDSEEALTEYCKYEYGAEGILSEIRYFDANGSEILSEQCNESGLINEGATKDGNLSERYEYDQAGNKTHYIERNFWAGHMHYYEESWWEYLQVFRPAAEN
jgi:hypothetical protein